MCTPTDNLDQVIHDLARAIVVSHGTERWVSTIVAIYRAGVYFYDFSTHVDGRSGVSFLTACLVPNVSSLSLLQQVE